MNRITNEQREAIVREAVAKRDALLGGKPDCAGGIRCSDCPGKNYCKTGCIRQPEFISGAAQGGQQPAGVTFPMPDKPGLTMACFDAQTVPVRTPLYTAPAAPAAPLTEKDMEKLWLRETDKHSISQWAAFSLIRAVEAFHGITLAGTAQSPMTDAERFCDSNCTWMEHHPDCKASTAQKESADGR